MTGPRWKPDAMLAEVRRQVRDLLERTPAYRSLPPERQRQIAANTVAVAAYLANPDGTFTGDFASAARVRIPLPKEIQAAGDQAGDLIGEVDFPGFVAGLIQGVFEAIVDASIRQMEAYGKLVADAAKTVEEFLQDGDSDDDDRLARSYAVKTTPHPPHHRQVALERQQRLLSTLTMGINRIVVTDG